MTILELRILPPIAIGRLGSSAIPVYAYTLEVSTEKPLDFRTIKVQESLKVNPQNGQVETFVPEKIIFKDTTSIRDNNGTVRPVAPFLEIFAVTDDDPSILVPLTNDILNKCGYSIKSVKWTVRVGNVKLYRRTFDENDKIFAEVAGFNDHVSHPLTGQCKNFVSGKSLPLGQVQFINPNKENPGYRLRFTPAHGKVYGSFPKRIETEGNDPVDDPLYLKHGEDFLLYNPDGPWAKYEEGNQTLPVLTNPGAIFAGYDKGGLWASWGYLDDECDGYVMFELVNDKGVTVQKAHAHVVAGPPAYAPDTLPVRVVSDELEQILYGPEIDKNKEVPIEEAQDIVRRALETVRLMNTAIMNGNNYFGRERTASTMVVQDSNDFGRMYEPIMAPSLVDNLAVRAIHERVFNGLGTGNAPWFESALRRPDKIGDLSNAERRKMPAMMRGADARALCFTYRQINTIIKSAVSSIFRTEGKLLKDSTDMIEKDDRYSQLHYRGKGNPYSVLSRSAISNCFPGLEFDFRNLWRRMLQGILLIENNNFVIDTDPEFSHLKHHRLVGIKERPTMVVTTGPTFPRSSNQTLINTANPNAVSFMEWSNNIAHILDKQGSLVDCYFTKEECIPEIVVIADDLKESNSNLICVPMVVNNFFEKSSASIAGNMVNPGDLTQGLCSPWQNDYRECACYYWAASRPDYVNVVPDGNGLSKGDNWMSKVRDGNYVPDNRQDNRLMSYDDLFMNWEGELNFIVKGFDAIDSNGATRK